MRPIIVSKRTPSREVPVVLERRSPHLHLDAGLLPLQALRQVHHLGLRAPDGELVPVGSRRWHPVVADDDRNPAGCHHLEEPYRRRAVSPRAEHELGPRDQVDEVSSLRGEVRSIRLVEDETRCVHHDAALARQREDRATHWMRRRSGEAVEQIRRRRSERGELGVVDPRVRHCALVSTERMVGHAHVEPGQGAPRKVAFVVDEAPFRPPRSKRMRLQRS